MWWSLHCCTDCRPQISWEGPKLQRINTTKEMCIKMNQVPLWHHTHPVGKEPEHSDNVTHHWDFWRPQLSQTWIEALETLQDPLILKSNDCSVWMRSYLLARVQHAELGALLLGVHQHVEHGADGQRNPEVRRLTRLLHFGVKGRFCSVGREWKRVLSQWLIWDVEMEKEMDR